jgi:hypothetical protein
VVHDKAVALTHQVGRQEIEVTRQVVIPVHQAEAVDHLTVRLVEVARLADQVGQVAHQVGQVGQAVAHAGVEIKKYF